MSLAWNFRPVKFFLPIYNYVYIRKVYYDLIEFFNN